MTLPRGSGARYERWRSQWLAGTDSQALATLRWHGMAVGLRLTAPHTAWAAIPPAPAAPAEAPHPAAIAAAARQIRAVLHPSGGHTLA